MFWDTLRLLSNFTTFCEVREQNCYFFVKRRKSQLLKSGVKNTFKPKLNHESTFHNMISGPLYFPNLQSNLIINFKIHAAIN